MFEQPVLEEHKQLASVTGKRNDKPLQEALIDVTFGAILALCTRPQCAGPPSSIKRRPRQQICHASAQDLRITFRRVVRCIWPPVA